MAADQKVFGFNQNDAQQIINLLGSTGGEVKQFEYDLTKPVAGNVVHAYTPSGGIPARSSLTMGSASCDLYESSTGGVLSDSGSNITVYNMASGAVAGNTHIIASKNEIGIYVCIVEDCG